MHLCAISRRPESFGINQKWRCRSSSSAALHVLCALRARRSHHRITSSSPHAPVLNHARAHTHATHSRLALPSCGQSAPRRSLCDGAARNLTSTCDSVRSGLPHGARACALVMCLSVCVIFYRYISERLRARCAFAPRAECVYFCIVLCKSHRLPINHRRW